MSQMQQPSKPSTCKTPRRINLERREKAPRFRSVGNAWAKLIEMGRAKIEEDQLPRFKRLSALQSRSSCLVCSTSQT